jgi:hypothetical protein
MGLLSTSGGFMEALEVSAYSQLPPPELKNSTLIQSKGISYTN